ncbi:hypothetical protein AG0111_0g221 [Alternaria gaisen]|uniref:Uncharacterized protein n=1 Tax=Alternaria gaisen TaxID=167740 RepID=A0ACB6G2T1_9PLEO|nr:hypothetical protein AG0111_0g221 [Alternaria gaisen]
MDEVSSDTDISITSLRSSLLSPSNPPSSPPTFLTVYQLSLVSAYKSCGDHVNSLMNTVVDLEISVRRERDEPSLRYLVEELDKAQEELVLYRDGRRKKEREIKEEEKKLKLIAGTGSIIAKRQLNDMGMHMSKERTVLCLR